MLLGDSFNIMPGYFNLQNKNIFITGAFGLFGSQIIECFFKRGACLTLCGHNQEKIDYWLKTKSGEYDINRYITTALEITDPDSINNAVEKSIDKFGKIDILINNAAIDAKFDSSKIGDLNKTEFENYPIENIRNSIEVNIIGTIQVTQAVCRKMIKQGYGNIINVGSIYSIIAPNPALYSNCASGPNFKPIDYVISKSFIPNFTRYIAANYAGKKIRCNAIAPHGVFDKHDDEFIQSFAKLSPLGRMCNKEELDGPFLFLASDDSSYLNGFTLVLDGGWTIW